MKNIFAVILLLSCYRANAQSPFKTQSIAVFKDGTSFVQKSGSVNAINGIFSFVGNDIPQALFGTFWITSPTSKIGQVISYMDTVKKVTTESPQNILQILEAMTGKNVVIKLSYEIPLYEGKIIDIGFEKLPLFTGRDIILGADKDPALVHFLTKNGRHKYILAKDIISIESEEDVRPVYKKQEKILTPTLDIAFENTKTAHELKIMYLQKGLSWSPFYSLELQEAGKAKLILRSEVSNNAEAITSSDINFVVGVPNFRYAKSLAGLVNFVNLQNGEINFENNISQANTFMNTSAVLGEAADEKESYQPSNFGNDIEGENVQDLYFYNLKNISLKKGAKAHYELFNATVDYEHIFECELSRNTEDYQYSQDYTAGPDVKNLVFHGIKIKNNCSNPFTAAPVLLTEKREDKIFPIAQDLMPYTPMQAASIIRLTSTSDIQVSQTEKQKTTTEKIRKWNGRFWDKVEVDSKIIIKNYKKTACKIIIKRFVAGDMIKSSADWNKVQLNPIASSLNFLNKVEWTITVNPGEEKIINYSYNYYHAGEQ